MNLDDFLDQWASAIVAIAMLVILLSVLSPSIGDLLFSILPTIVEWAVYVLVIAVLAYIILQLLTE